MINVGKYAIHGCYGYGKLTYRFMNLYALFITEFTCNTYTVHHVFSEKTGNRPPQQLIWMFCCSSARIGNSHAQSHARSLFVSFLVLQSGWRHVTFSHVHAQSRITLPETNIAPENRPFQTESSFPTTIFQWLYGYFSFRW